MSGRYALIEMAFVSCTVLGFAFWDLRKTTRGGDKKKPPSD